LDASVWNNSVQCARWGTLALNLSTASILLAHCLSQNAHCSWKKQTICNTSTTTTTIIITHGTSRVFVSVITWRNSALFAHL
jgi:hypothetical protein